MKKIFSNLSATRIVERVIANVLAKIIWYALGLVGFAVVAVFYFYGSDSAKPVEEAIQTKNTEEIKLDEITEEILDYYIEKAEKGDWDARNIVMEIAEKKENPKAVDSVVRMAENGNWDARNLVMKLADERGNSKAIDSVIRIAKSGNWDAKRLVFKLARAENSKAITATKQMAKDGDWDAEQVLDEIIEKKVLN